MIRATIAAIALSVGILSQAWAYRVLEQVEQAYELRLGNVTLPDQMNGSVIFTPCADCRTMSLRVTDGTKYSVAGSSVDLQTLRQRADELRATIDGQRRVGVYIYVDPASLRVTRLKLSP